VYRRAHQAWERLNNRAGILVEARSAKFAAMRVELIGLSFQRTDARAVERGKTLTQLVAKNHNYFCASDRIFSAIEDLTQRR
jgi:hypothetical protein